MISLFVLLLATPETIALRLEDAGEVPRVEARSLLEAVAERIEARTGGRVVIDDGDFPCRSADRCVDAIKARAKASTAVLLKMVRGPRRIHLEAWKEPRLESEINVPKDHTETKARLDELVAALFPTPPVVFEAPPPTIAVEPPPPIVVAPTPSPPPEGGIRVLPIALAGAALVVGGIGLGFGLSSNRAGAELAEGPLLSDRYEELRGQESDHAMAANICWIGAGALLAGAAVSWWLEAP